MRTATAAHGGGPGLVRSAPQAHRLVLPHASALRRRRRGGVLVLLSLALITSPSASRRAAACTASQTPARPCCGRSRSPPTRRAPVPRRVRLVRRPGAREVRERAAARRGRQAAAAGIQNATALAGERRSQRQLRLHRRPALPAGLPPRRPRASSRGAPSEFAAADHRSPPARAAGIRVRRPVVTRDGLVGKVTQVAANVAQVTLLTDPTRAVPALDLETSAYGLVRHGQGGGTLIARPGAEGQVAAARATSSSPRACSSATLRRSTRTASRSGASASVGQTDTSTSTSRSRSTPFVDFASLDAVIVLVPKSGTDDREPARRGKAALLLFVAAILQVSIFSQSTSSAAPRPPARHARRGRAAPRLDLGAVGRLLRRAAPRHGEPRHARLHVAAADARRLLDRPLRRDDRPRPRARAVRVGRRVTILVPARRARPALPARRARLRRGACCSRRSCRRSRSTCS